jgi:hypothetical protein
MEEVVLFTYILKTKIKLNNQLNNGAIELQVNEETQNFEYKI